jgi:hypothetical protein
MKTTHAYAEYVTQQLLHVSTTCAAATTTVALMTACTRVHVESATLQPADTYGLPPKYKERQCVDRWESYCAQISM